MHTNTLLHPLSLRRAEPADLPGVLTLLADTAEWLYTQGVRQWPRGGFGPERIEPLIEERVLFLLDDELRYLDPDESAPPVATIAIDDHADPEFWTLADDPGAALYIHKLAVARPLVGLRPRGRPARLGLRLGLLGGPALGPPRLRQGQPAAAGLLPRSRLPSRTHGGPAAPIVGRALPAPVGGRADHGLP
ncbi:hypothetical protein GCM10020220_080760 [Nonomuraea rubra]|uniref:hypothetical protein n=1 Tax=Nonomuraea rubra TaxID=46180 RepID=UPI0031ECE127